MDFYSYFKEQFTWGSNPYTVAFDCQQIIAELIDNPKIPFYFSASATVGFLAALTDQAGNGGTVTTTFQNTMKLMDDVCQRMQRVAQAADRVWLLETQEREADGIPLYDPGDYEAWPVDLDNGEGEEDDGADEGEPKCNGILEAMEGYCSSLEGLAPGTRRPFPDWARCVSWTSGDWVRFQVHKEKILAAAKLHDFSAVGTVTNTIAAASAHMSLLPVPRQAEIALWCKQLADELCTHMDANLQGLCAGTLYTPAGQTTQKASLE